MTVARVLEHLYLVGASLVLSILVGLVLGVLAYWFPKLSRPILWLVDILQTIPSLATLGIVMIFCGAGATTVIIGITLYSLLPIVRNTYAGLSGLSSAIWEAAVGMGMNRWQRLFLVEIPAAFPMIFTGIRIAAVTSIGVAVFGIFVGGGGLGSVIYRGIYIQNMGMIAAGTGALVLIAMILDYGMGFIEGRLYKKLGQVKEGKA